MAATKNIVQTDSSTAIIDNNDYIFVIIIMRVPEGQLLMDPSNTIA